MCETCARTKQLPLDFFLFRGARCSNRIYFGIFKYAKRRKKKRSSVNWLAILLAFFFFCRGNRESHFIIALLISFGKKKWQLKQFSSKHQLTHMVWFGIFGSYSSNYLATNRGWIEFLSVFASSSSTQSLIRTFGCEIVDSDKSMSYDK